MATDSRVHASHPAEAVNLEWYEGRLQGNAHPTEPLVPWPFKETWVPVWTNGFIDDTNRPVLCLLLLRTVQDAHDKQLLALHFPWRQALCYLLCELRTGIRFARRDPAEAGNVGGLSRAHELDWIDSYRTGRSSESQPTHPQPIAR